MIDPYDITAPGDWPIDPQVVNGTELAERLNRFFKAYQSNQSSSTRPPDIADGGLWSKTSATGVVLMYYDGGVDYPIMTLEDGKPPKIGTPTTDIAGASGVFAGPVTATTGTFSGNVQMASLNGGQLAGLRNKIINGNMGIFQRGTAAVTTNSYGPADRWLNGILGGSFSTTQGSFVSGDTLYDTGGAQYFTQIAVTSPGTAADDYMNFFQRIEDVRILAGQTVTVSFWAKAASGTPSIAVEISQNFGSGGSPSARVSGTGQAQALTTTWTKYSKTFSLPSINGKTIGTTANSSCTVVTFWLGAGSTYATQSASIGQSSKTVSIAQVQLEVGPVATPFEQRPYGMELALCQRYYEIGTINWLDYFSTTDGHTIPISFAVTKRATPATTLSAATAAINISSSSIRQNYTSGFSLLVNPIAVLASELIQSWQAPAEL